VIDLIALVAMLSVGAAAPVSPASPPEILRVESGFTRARYIVTRQGVRSPCLPSHDVAGFTQRSRLLPGGRTEVTVVVRAGAPARWPEAPPMLAEGTPEPAIATLAKELAKGGGGAWERSERILAWVSTEIEHEEQPQHDDSALAALESRRASCVGRSELAVALLHAAGIPARTVHGLIADESEPAGFKLHRYVESFVDGVGWVPSDPGESIHLVDAHHLFIATDVAPYDPAEQRGLSVTVAERPQPLFVEHAPSPGRRPILLLPFIRREAP
jgi:transglutaminase-like putative cysteine protease